MDVLLFGPILIVKFCIRDITAEHTPAPSVLNQMEWQSRDGVQGLEKQKVHIHLCIRKR